MQTNYSDRFRLNNYCKKKKPTTKTIVIISPKQINSQIVSTIE